MGFSLRFGVGPLRYTKSLTGGRKSGSGLTSAFVTLFGAMLMLGVWAMIAALLLTVGLCAYAATIVTDVATRTTWQRTTALTGWIGRKLK